MTDKLKDLLAVCDQIEQLSESTTPSPWVYDPENLKSGRVRYSNARQMIWGPRGPGYGTVAETCSSGSTPYPSGVQAADAELITLMANNIGPLIAALRAAVDVARFHAYMRKDATSEAGRSALAEIARVLKDNE